MGKSSLRMNVFDGGMNTKAQELILPPNQSPYIADWAFDDYGAMVTRGGYKTHNSTQFGAGGAIDGMRSYRPASATAQLLVVCGETVQAIVGTTPAAIASAQSLFTALSPCEICVFQELAFFSNGGQQAYKYNGAEFTRAGVSAPAQNITAVCDAAAGNLNGTYQYVFQGVNSYAAEGDYGSPSTAVAIVSGKARLNNIPTAPISHGINYWKVARNTAGASGLFWYLTDVTNGVTSYTDNVADASLITEAPTDQGYLRRFNYLLAYAGRLWGAVEDYLWFSNENQPEEFPSTNYIRVGRGDGMRISSIAAFKGQIVVSKSDFNGKTAIYVLAVGDSVTFNDPENWYLSKISDFGGSESHRATISYSNYLLLFNRTGAYAYNGAGISLANNGGVLSDTISENVEDRLRSSTLALQPLLRGAAAINWKNKILLSLDDGDRQAGALGSTSIPINGKNFWFDYSRISDSSRKSGAWALALYNGTSARYKGFSCFEIHDGKLLAGDSGAEGTDGGGFIYELENGFLDGIWPVLPQFYTSHFQGKKGEEGIWKDFRHVIITAKGVGQLSVYFHVDAEVRRDLSAGGRIFLGNITLSTTITATKFNLPSTANGKRIYFAFVPAISDDTKTCTVNSLELLYTLRGIRNA